MGRRAEPQRRRALAARAPVDVNGGVGRLHIDPQLPCPCRQVDGDRFARSRLQADLRKAKKRLEAPKLAKDHVEKVAAKIAKAEKKGYPAPTWANEMAFLHDDRANPVIAWPMRLFDCSPVSDGAAALLLVSEELVKVICSIR